MTPVQRLGAPDLTLVDLARSATKFGRAVTVRQQMAQNARQVGTCSLPLQRATGTSQEEFVRLTE